MIGHYVNNLMPEQEARVLTQPFERLLPSRGSRPPEDLGNCRCLVLTATDGASMFGPAWEADYLLAPGYCYEFLCERFGEARVNAAIRNRILANQARRAQAGVQELEAVHG